MIRKQAAVLRARLAKRSVLAGTIALFTEGVALLAVTGYGNQCNAWQLASIAIRRGCLGQTKRHRYPGRICASSQSWG